VIHDLPDFALEVYLGAREFSLRHHLTAADSQSSTIGELLAMGTESDRKQFMTTPMTYIDTWGTRALREAISETYELVRPDDTLAFAGAEEAMFWVMQLLVSAGDHAIVTAPNYQSMESVPIAAGAAVSALPLWEGSGDALRWTLDLDRLRTLIRPTTKLIAVNFPNNPTGFVPDPQTWQGLVERLSRSSLILGERPLGTCAS
jgi:aspartate/methionine/tyrosine aminotransferase